MGVMVIKGEKIMKKKIKEKELMSNMLSINKNEVVELSLNGELTQDYMGRIQDIVEFVEILMDWLENPDWICIEINLEKDSILLDLDKPNKNNIFINYLIRALNSKIN